MTFTYNLNKSSLETYLGQTLNGFTQSLIEQALTANGLQPASGKGTSLVLDEDGGAATLTSPGHLFIADDPSGSTISVTDTAGGNIIAVGEYADKLTIDNNGPLMDTIIGGGNTGESISLGPGSFLVVGGAGTRETINGGSGFNNIYGGTAGRTFIQAGSGSGYYGGDTSSSAAYSYDTIVAGTGAGQILGVANGHNVLYGTAIGSTTGSAVQNTLWGGAGTDTLWGGGHSEMHAGSGSEFLWGGGWSNSADTLVAGSGSDQLGAWAGDNLIIGYNTDDIRNVNDPTKGTIYQTGANTIWTGSGKDTVFGGGHSEIDTVNDTLHAGGGQTTIWAGRFAGSSDTINAGVGDVYVGLGQGNNSIHGGSGTLTAWTGSGNDTITLGSGSDTIGVASGNSSIVGGTGHDTIFYWSSANSTIVGGSDTTIDIVSNAANGGVASTSTIAGGATTLTFTDGHTLTYSNAKLNIVSHETISSGFK